jgi:nickel transport protein
MLLLLLCAATLPSPETALAHRLYVFARDEDGQVCGRGYFSKKSGARDAPFAATDRRGNVLASGRTDQDGKFCFERSGKDALIISVDAEMGHRGEFSLSAATENATDGGADAPASEPPRAPEASSPLAQDALEPLLRRVIREELRRAPSAAREEEGPGFRDLVGGLGWIAGLAALFAWWGKRRAS